MAYLGNHIIPEPAVSAEAQKEDKEYQRLTLGAYPFRELIKAFNRSKENKNDR